MTQTKGNQQVAECRLGDYLPKIYLFTEMKAFDAYLHSEKFSRLPPRQRFRTLAEKLIAMILEAPEEVFLLPAVLEIIDHVNRANILPEQIFFSHLEFWLNHYSNLDPETNQKIRSKIMGKAVPRDVYQCFFPIGMGKVYRGTHFVIAHLSPDVDTMIASFWGWVDAFAARVGDGLHVWCLPGGPPESPVTSLFREVFGKQSIEIMGRFDSTVTLSSMDLVTHKDLNKKHGGINISHLDHGASQRAIILIDDDGHYKGDWRSSDVEYVRQVIILFKACLRWFENNLHFQLIRFLGQEKVTRDHIVDFLLAGFRKRISDSDASHEYSSHQRKNLNSFLTTILHLEDGMDSTFSELNDALVTQGVHALDTFESEMEKLRDSDLFDSNGILCEDRPTIFGHIEKIHQQLNAAILEVRDWAERLDVSIAIKEKVLNLTSFTVNMRAEVDVLRGKMRDYDYIPITVTEEDGRQYPVGVVWDKDLRQAELGTVSFRDFSNFDEVKMASYLTVISVIDHHKTAITTHTPPLVLLGDAQACNVLVAEQTIRINDRYSLLGLAPSSIRKKLPEQEKEAQSTRLKERLMNRRLAAEHHKGHWVDPGREFIEYLFFIHAILDDTDLMTKVSARDVICVAELINRLKSLQLQQDVEIITLDDIPQNAEFAKAAATRILRNEDMYSIYKKSFDVRQREVEESLKHCVEGKPSSLFGDTKEQNGCNRIGQAKLFPDNMPYLKEHEEAIRGAWVDRARAIQQSHPEMDLHLFMISTIASAEDLYEGRKGGYDHEDELWIWIPDTQLAQNHLASFLGAFGGAAELSHMTFEADISNKEVALAFKRNFAGQITINECKEKIGQPQATLRFKAGRLNSRKAMISPYLPKLLV